MPFITMLTGVILALIGVGGYLATGQTHLTALIPAAFGLLFLLAGVIARTWPGSRKHVMHVIVSVALLAVFGTVGGLFRLVNWGLAGVTPERPAASIAQGLTAVVCAVFIGLAVRSFILARRAR